MLTCCRFPNLTVRHLGRDVNVSWPFANTAGFALEQTAILAAPTAWSISTAPISDDGNTRSVTLPATNSAQLFRLRRQ